MQNKLIKVLSIICALLLLVGMGVCVYDTAMNENGFTNCLQPILLAVTSAFGVYYVLAGCKKGEGSTYFKWFVNMFALAIFLALINHSEMHIVHVLLVAIGFGALTVLSCALNLGQKKSTLLAVIILAVMVIRMILCCSEGLDTYILIRVGVQLVLGITTLVMIGAKYADKKSRGSK